MATLSYLDWIQLLLAFIFSTASDCGIGEGSWAGICFRPIHWSTVAVARSFCKSIDVYDPDIHLRNLRTLWYPSSLSFIQSSMYCNGDSSVLAVAEGSQLSIWDLRTNHNGGCIRVCGSIGDLIYSVCSSLSGTIAVVGTDRNVTVYDPRRWSAMSRWVNCSKYEITGLSFSSIDSAYIYVQGVDYEVMCGRWRESEKALSFRGDSNLLGFSKLVRRARAECGYHLWCFCYCTPDWRNYMITTEAASNINEQQRTCWASRERVGRASDGDFATTMHTQMVALNDWKLRKIICVAVSVFSNVFHIVSIFYVINCFKLWQ